MYALIENNNRLSAMKKTIDGGKTWTAVSVPADADGGIPSSDFTRSQAWYDLVAAVDPNNENILLAGGIDLFRSANGGSNWSQISKWASTGNLSSLACAYAHADQHAIAFQPGSSSNVVFGNDGGIFYT